MMTRPLRDDDDDDDSDEGEEEEVDNACFVLFCILCFDFCVLCFVFSVLRSVFVFCAGRTDDRRRGHGQETGFLM